MCFDSNCIAFNLIQVVALCATGFLLGPRSQCRQMWAPTRRYTTGFYLVMLIIVFSVAMAVWRLNCLLKLYLFMRGYFTYKPQPILSVLMVAHSLLQRVNVGVVVALLFIQICAGIWYAASYIPFGRKIICSFLRQVPCFKPCFEAYDQHMAAKGGQQGNTMTGAGNGSISFTKLTGESKS